MFTRQEQIGIICVDLTVTNEGDHHVGTARYTLPRLKVTDSSKSSVAKENVSIRFDGRDEHRSICGLFCFLLFF